MALYSQRISQDLRGSKGKKSIRPAKSNGSLSPTDFLEINTKGGASTLRKVNSTEVWYKQKDSAIKKILKYICKFNSILSVK